MRVGIVGGGITGLSLLHHLRERDVDAVLHEAAAEPGGVIRSELRDGRVLEHGPQRLRLSEPVAELVEALGLTDELVLGDDSLPIYVYAAGSLRPVPRSIRRFLTTDLLSVRGKLRVLAEPLTAPGRSEETVADLFARKFGTETYENLVGPLFGGMYASDPERMPARHSLSSLLRLEEREGSLLRGALSQLGGETPPPASFEGGLQRLPRALAERHAASVELDAPVTGLGRNGDGFTIGTAGGRTDVDRVVLTTPARAAADLLSGLAPDAADRLGGLAYNPLALVHLVSDARRAGFGYQVRRGEGLHTLGVTFNASLFDREHLFTAFLGGMTDPDVLAGDDDALGALAAAEFEAVMGEPAEVVNVTRLSPGFPAYDDSWDALDGLQLPPGVTLATNYTARMGIPSRVREARSLAASLAEGDPSV